jgi:hypothetical protein
MKIPTLNRASARRELVQLSDDMELFVPAYVLERRGDALIPAEPRELLIPLSVLTGKEKERKPLAMPKRPLPLAPLQKDPSPGRIPPHPGTGVPKNPAPPKK